jgi:chorismate mutase/prephenate dehydratase
MSDQDDKTAIEELRARIDALDLRILQLLNQRAEVALLVGAEKHKTNTPVFRPEREAQVLAGLEARNTGPLKSEHLRAVYRELMSACRALERPTTVAFLGPSGTFSEQAVLARFGSSVVGLACATIPAIFRVVELNEADFGVVPLENSSEGAIGQTLDCLLASSLRLSAEVALRIEHHLLTRTGLLSDVTRVCAHPQALGQCAQWLQSHAPGLELVAASSNGEAARLAAADSGLAAIASEHAARIYGLVATARQIQDDSNNTTRFGIIGRHRTSPSGRDRTSLALSVDHRAGAVVDMLTPLKQHGVSMTRFESRPARTGGWTYHFFIDIEGHEDDPRVAAALSDLRAAAGFFKVLGAYPTE